MHVSLGSGILPGRWLAMIVAITTMGFSQIGCNSEKQTRTPEDETPTTERVASEKAIESLSEARCEYEKRCGNVGEGRTYADDDHCQSRFETDYGKELNAWECPGGIHAIELKECLDEFRNNECDSPLDTLERMIACRSSKLCKEER